MKETSFEDGQRVFGFMAHGCIAKFQLSLLPLVLKCDHVPAKIESKLHQSYIEPRGDLKRSAKYVVKPLVTADW